MNGELAFSLAKMPGVAGSKFLGFRVVTQENHTNSKRKKGQSATQRKIHRKPAQFFENSTNFIYYVWNISLSHCSLCYEMWYHKIRVELMLLY
jgi:hypothetical protein